MAQVPPFAIALAAGSGISFLFAVLAWNKRSEPGAIPLVVFHLAVGVGTGAYALEIVSTDLALQVPLLKTWLFAQALVPPTWLFAAVEYSGRARWATRRTATALAVEPLAFGIALLVPRLRRYVFQLPERGVLGSLVPARVDLGVLSLVHYLYLFALALIGSALLVQLFLRSRHLYRTEAIAVLVAATAPFITVLAQALGLTPETDPSALTWALSGMALTTGLYRFKTLDPVPAARSAIVEEMGEGAIVLDEDGLVSDANPAAERLLADAGDGLLGRHVAEVIDEWESVPGAPDGDTDGSHVVSDRGPDEWREFSKRADGRERYLEAQASRFTDRFDNHVGTLAVIRDVTRRKEREESLAHYKTVLEATSEKVYVLDGDGRFTIVNQSLADFLGRDPEDLIGEPFETILTVDSAVPVGAGQAPVDWDWDAVTEIGVETAAGEVVPCETRLTPVEFGAVSGSVGFLRDISQRRRVEADLRTTSERLETLVEASPLAVVATDPVGNVDIWNPTAETMFGYEAEAVEGDTAPIIPDDERDRIETLYGRVLDGARLTDIETSLVRADGDRIAASVSMAPLRDGDSTVRGVVSIIADITERKERERELRRTNERLEEFASVVSHDLRNPLQVAEANVEHVVSTGDLERASNALDALHRMETLIEDVLTLARQGEDIGATAPVALGTVVEAAWTHVETDAATLKTGSLPTVQGDSDRLQELFENLFRNALEHGSTGSQNAERSGDAVEHVGDDVTVVVAPSADGFYVADDGPGIPADRRDEVFEAGVTTADDGTGFGLSIVEQIATAHGWTVRIDPDGPDPASLPDAVPDPSSIDGACFEFVIGES